MITSVLLCHARPPLDWYCPRLRDRTNPPVVAHCSTAPGRRHQRTRPEPLLQAGQHSLWPHHSTRSNPLLPDGHHSSWPTTPSWAAPFHPSWATTLGRPQHAPCLRGCVCATMHYLHSWPFIICCHSLHGEKAPSTRKNSPSSRQSLTAR